MDSELWSWKCLYTRKCFAFKKNFLKEYMYIAWLFPIRSLSISLQKNYKTGKRKYPVDEENALLLLGFFFFFFWLCPALLSPTKSIFMFARIKYRFLHCSGQKHFFLFKTSNSKKTGLQIMYFKRKRRKRKKKKKRAINSYFFKITDRLLWQMKPHPVLLKLPRVTSYQANEKKSFMSFLDASMSLYTKCRAVYISSTIFFMYYLIKCLEHA